MGNGVFDYGQEESQAFAGDQETEVAAGRIPVGAFIPGAQAGTTQMTEQVTTLPGFFSPLVPNTIYLGLPSSYDDSIDQAGSGKAWKMWYADLYDGSAEAWPLWLDLAEIVDEMTQNRSDWEETGEHADEQLEQIRVLNERTDGGLESVLAEYLAGEDRVDAAKSQITAAVADAGAAAHELSEAHELIDENEESEKADVKKGEVAARDKAVRDGVKRAKMVLSIAQSIIGVALNPASTPGAAVGIINTMIDADDFAAMDVELFMLKHQLSEIEARMKSHRRKAKAENAAAAAKKLEAAQHKIEKAKKDLTAAKLDVGKAVSKLRTMEKQGNKKDKRNKKGKNSTVFSEINERSDETQTIVGVEGGGFMKPGKKNATNPVEMFGDNTLRARAAELIEIFGRPEFGKADHMMELLWVDKETVDERKQRFNIPEAALDGIHRWEQVWETMKDWTRKFGNDYKAIMRTVRKLAFDGAGGAHFDKRREILRSVADHLKVNRE